MVKINMDIEVFISLTTEKELNKSDRKLWLDIITDFGPQDIVSSVQVYTEEGLKNKKLLIKKSVDKFEYTVPLKRDLLQEEAEKIVEAWDAYFNDEFEIETSTKIQENTDIAEENDEDDDIEFFAEELAKITHKNRINKLQEDGWRYGENYSVKNKTTPDILPWEQLSEKNKKIDYDLAHDVVELFEKMGYEISKEEE